MNHTIKLHDMFRFITGDLNVAINEAEAFSKEHGESVDVFEEVDGEDCFVCSVDAGMLPGDQTMITFPSNLVGATVQADDLPF